MLRTFTLNSPEFYELVREPREAPREQDVWETSGHEGVKKRKRRKGG